MNNVRSSDGTTIAFDQWGEGAPLIYPVVLAVAACILWVPESRSWVLSCEFARGVAGPR